MASVAPPPPPSPRCRPHSRRHSTAGPLLHLVAAVAALLLFAAGAGRPAAGVSANDARFLDSLLSSSRKDPANLVPMNAAMLTRALSITPRPFSMVITLLADGCAACDAGAKLLAAAAKEVATGPPAGRPVPPVVFAGVAVSSGDTAFLTATRITHVPKVYHLSPTVKWPVVMAGGPDDLGAQSGLTDGAIKGWLNDRLGTRLAVRRAGYAVPFVPVIKSLAPLLFVAAAAAAVAVGWTGTWRSPWLYFAMLMGVYAFSLAGGHYAWIHGVPWAVVDASGVTRYVADGSRSQYGAEGVATATGCVLMGGLWVVVHELPCWLGEGGGALSRAASWAAALAIWFGWTALVGLYSGKMPGYLTYTAQ